MVMVIKMLMVMVMERVGVSAYEKKTLERLYGHEHKQEIAL